jgi:hypothetical protein
MKEPRKSAQVGVGVSQPLEPGVFFYRRRYHLDWIHIQPLSAKNDFQIVADADGKPRLQSSAH